ncbi:hypothetical protein [Burkholderia sp. S-53]|uniref:hypothetical protein n=1 Tax=Burkholderia sp. S-53 TaxID=2906514 RepID=UPI0021CDEF82|nr:hypothetical protein [Burkholderia sp. S-53]UXU92191.1 hypothetical protein LXM88_29040 [Burkholderia sp. S-53]
MPVDFSTLPPEVVSDAKPPRPIVWFLLAMIIIAGGAALVLWLWPKGTSTHDWQFWTWVIAVPSLVYALLFAARWHLYEQALAQVEAFNRQRRSVVVHNTAFAQRPLALLASAYVTAMGEQDVAKRIIQHESMLGFRPVRGIGSSVSHTAIVAQKREGRETEQRRTRRDAFPLTNDDLLELFGKLITRMQPTLAALPSQIVLPVQLVVTGSEYPLDIAKQWETAWRAFGLGEFVLSSQSNEQGLMTLDAWLDESDGARRNRVALYVNVQFRDDPPDNGAEAATAMLVAWPDMAHRLKQPVLAWLHRPVRSIADGFGVTLGTALTWGAVSSVNETHAWASGLEADGRECLAHAFKQSATEPTSGDENAVMTANIDTSLGITGHAAGWLACALAAENFAATDRPQLIATQDGNGLVYAVVRKSSLQQPEGMQQS